MSVVHFNNMVKNTHLYNTYSLYLLCSSSPAAWPRSGPDWGRVSCSWWFWWRHGIAPSDRMLSPPAQRNLCRWGSLSRTVPGISLRSSLCSHGCHRQSHRCRFCAPSCASCPPLGSGPPVASFWHNIPGKHSFIICNTIVMYIYICSKKHFAFRLSLFFLYFSFLCKYSY